MLYIFFLEIHPEKLGSYSTRSADRVCNYRFHRRSLPKKAQRQDSMKISVTEALALDAELEL